jgi:WASH complex subunit 7
MSYLDKFRRVITMLGNTLGFVRMIRTASIKDSSSTFKFIPKEAIECDFEQACKDMEIEGELLEAAKSFDRSIKMLHTQEAEAKDYLRDLVKVFDGVFKGEENKHLKLFFMIIPPLTINFVESLRIAKDKVMKKRQVGTYFSDDGFALGLAYVLKVLGQTKRFKSLNWFESIEEKLSSDEKNIKDTREREDEDVEVDREINLRNVKTQSEEYSLMFYSFNAAQIFFSDI